MARHHARHDGADRQRETRPTWAILTGFVRYAAPLLVGVALLSVAAIVALAATHTPPARVSGGAGTNMQSADTAQTSGGWITLRSNAPADIIAATRRSSLFNANTAGNGDHVSDLSRLGVPILVRAIQPPGATAGQYPDFYVVPILDRSGAASGAAELQLNQAHTAIHVIAIVTYTSPRAHGNLAPSGPSAAQAALSAQRHLALRAGTAPTLSYFPGDAAAQETGRVTWKGGGEFPADPVWLVAGADGHDYVVGTDGRIYDIAQLPMVGTLP